MYQFGVKYQKPVLWQLMKVVGDMPGFVSTQWFADLVRYNLFDESHCYILLTKVMIEVSSRELISD